LRIGEISEIGRVSIRRNAHDGLADLEAGQGHFGVEADAAIGVRYVDLRILARDRILHHHRQELRVEGIVGELELGREPALVANDGVKAAIRHLLRLIVELGTLVVVRVVTVQNSMVLEGSSACALQRNPT
jgi:hypothetical protein